MSWISSWARNQSRRSRDAVPSAPTISVVSGSTPERRMAASNSL